MSADDATSRKRTQNVSRIAEVDPELSASSSSSSASAVPVNMNVPIAADYIRPRITSTPITNNGAAVAAAAANAVAGVAQSHCLVPNCCLAPHAHAHGHALCHGHTHAYAHGPNHGERRAATASAAVPSAASTSAAAAAPCCQAPLPPHMLFARYAESASLSSASSPPRSEDSMVSRRLAHIGDPTDAADMVQNALLSRAGSVLRRKTILKSDHFPSAMQHTRGIQLLECPNFRILEHNIYGVSQPTSLGLSTILTLLTARSEQRSSALWISTREEPVIYICGKPHVLRDIDAPFQNIKGISGISAQRLEQMESRLRDDVVKDAIRHSGLLLVHDESNSRQVIPRWVAADSVHTPRELVLSFIQNGYHVRYARIPVGPEQAPDAAFLDSLVNHICSSPLKSSVVISCGMGGGRTTLGTVVAYMIRQRLVEAPHLLQKSSPLSPNAQSAASTAKPATSPTKTKPSSNSHDHNDTANNNNLSNLNKTSSRPSSARARVSRSCDEIANAGLRENERVDVSKRNIFETTYATPRATGYSHIRPSSSAATIPTPVSAGTNPAPIEHSSGDTLPLLRVMYLLERGLATPLVAPHSAVEWALARGGLVSQLVLAVKGNFAIILDLVKLLDAEGACGCKHVLDSAIDLCDAVVNLREEILFFRIRHSIENGTSTDLNRAIFALERYFMLLAFTAYLYSSDFPKGTFVRWLHARPDIMRMQESIRGRQIKLQSFRPVEDLSELAAGGHEKSSGCEMENHVLARRHGTILSSGTQLRSDIWFNAGGMDESTNALNSSSSCPFGFRRIPQTQIYASSQPTVEGFDEVLVALTNERDRNPSLSMAHQTRQSTITMPNTPELISPVSPTLDASHSPKRSIVWINLREEPLIYIAGRPYVLRDQYMTETTVKSYGGINANRLGLLENRLKEDVITEVKQYSNKILVHTERLSRQSSSALHKTGNIRSSVSSSAFSLTGVSSQHGVSEESSSSHTREDRQLTNAVSEVVSAAGDVISNAGAPGNASNSEGRPHSSPSGMERIALVGPVTCNSTAQTSGLPSSSEMQERKLLAAWIDVTPEQIQTVCEIAKERNFDFHRVPVTAKHPPEEEDFDSLVKVVCKYPPDTPIVINCQAGLGRSTVGTIAVCLIRKWMCHSAPTKKPEPGFRHRLSITSVPSSSASSSASRMQPESPQSIASAFANSISTGNASAGGGCFYSSNLNFNSALQSLSENETNTSDCVTYKCIHSLLRVIRDGLKVKETVDKAIDDCGQMVNIRTAIERDRQNPARAARALLNLRRYFLLIVFQAYLSEIPEATNTTHSTLESFRSWMRRHPEVRKMHTELQECTDDVDRTMDALTAVEKMAPGDGIALSSEILKVVNGRRGSVLARLTILKSDAFIGCQKLSLPERIEGAQNFRFISFSDIRSALFQALGLSCDFGQRTLGLADSSNAIPEEQENNSSGSQGWSTEPGVCGVAMPTITGIEQVCKRLGARPGGSRVYWTCLREEPVLYINQRPYVLRTFREPLRNIEITGIAREGVEQMERQMRADALSELAQYNGRLLLHDEAAVKTGVSDASSSSGSSPSSGKGSAENDNAAKSIAGGSGGALTKPVVASTSGANSMGFEILPLWETVKHGEVLTPLDAFIAHESQIDYLRIPITDEQAPIPNVFDELVERTADFNGTFVFNCQMGRGRTTTELANGATYVSIDSETGLVDQDELIISNSSSKQDESRETTLWVGGGGVQLGMFSGHKISLSAESFEMQDSAVARYRRGEYQIVLRLVAVLSHGKLAKVLADTCIDTCSHMQNLREEIHSFKVRLESLTPGTAKYKTCRTVGTNYLIRYFYLVAFAGYLLELVSTNSNAVQASTEALQTQAQQHILPQSSTFSSVNVNSAVSDPRKKDNSNRSMTSFTAGSLSRRPPPPATIKTPRGDVPYIMFSEWLQERREITAILREDSGELA